MTLNELVPLYRDPKSDMPVTQFNMKWVEQAGLVKFDFLGLKTLTVLKVAVELLARRGVVIDLAAIPLDDKGTYDLLARAEAVGVFQLESAGMRRALLDMRPDRFEDIIALVALYRPGPMANIPTYCARKHEMEAPEYIHPKLEPILKETFGVIVYQEQVMQAAQILAGYSLGDADLLRRAMGKKIRSEMQKQRSIFVDGCTERGIERQHAEAIFELLERFADYGFNKSHAAAYALVAYQTAYMKANYPVEFLAASMTLDMGNTDKLSEFRAEAERIGIKIDPPSVNRSDVAFEVDGNTHHLRARRAQGRRQGSGQVDHRRARERSLRRSCRLCRPHQSARRQQARAGKPGAGRRLRRFRQQSRARARRGRCRDGRARNAAMRPPRSGRANCSAAAASRKRSRCRISNPGCRPNGCGANMIRSDFSCPVIRSTITPRVLKKLRVQSWAEFSRAVKNGATAGKVAGTVVSRQERRTKTGNKMGIFGLSDPTGHYEAVIFSEGLAEYRDLLEPGTAVLLVLSAEVQGDDVRARIQSAEPLDAAAANMQKGLRVFLRDGAPLEGVAKRLEPSPKRGSGDGEVSVVLMLQAGHRGRGQTARPLQGLAADRRRHQGGAGRGAGRGAVGSAERPNPPCFPPIAPI